MEYIKWAPQFAVGIDEIDRDHQRLISLLNQLHTAVTQGRADNLLNQMLCDLNEYACKHFAYEEALMNRYKYPYFQEHLYRHDEFREELRELAAKDNNMKTMLSIELLEFLKEWVKDHILREDVKMSKYILVHDPAHKLVMHEH